MVDFRHLDRMTEREKRRRRLKMKGSGDLPTGKECRRHLWRRKRAKYYEIGDGPTAEDGWEGGA